MIIGKGLKYENKKIGNENSTLQNPSKPKIFIRTFLMKMEAVFHLNILVWMTRLNSRLIYV